MVPRNITGCIKEKDPPPTRNLIGVFMSSYAEPVIGEHLKSAQMVIKVYEKDVKKHLFTCKTVLKDLKIP